MEKAIQLVRNLINLVGATAGIVLISIGAVMLLNSLFVLYLFKIESDGYVDVSYRCDLYNPERIEAESLLNRGQLPYSPSAKIYLNTTNSSVKLTEKQKQELIEKYKKCIKEEEEKEKQNFQIRNKKTMATGLAFLIVGLPIFWFYQRRRNS